MSRVRALGAPIVLVTFLSTCAMDAVAQSPGSTPANGRPWVVQKSSSSEFDERLKAAGKDVAKLEELAAWCVAQRIPHRIATVFDSTPRTANVAVLLGYAQNVDPPALADALRFTPDARVLPTLASLDPKRKKDLLAAKDRPLKLANQSTYFDLTSDLESGILDQHSKMLNDYYRAMKNRFRAYPDTNVGVVIFANRSDYLRNYAASAGKSGESVLGYFVPAWRELYFYDDPYNRDEVALIARHECTHLLFNIAYGGAKVSDWLNEGMACYLAGDGENARGGYTMRLVLELATQAEKSSFDIEPVFSVTHQKLKYEHYAQAWAAVMFLDSGSRKEKFQKFLVALREVLKKDDKEAAAIQTVREALEAAFEDEVGSIAEDCARYVKETMSFQRPDQLLELGLAAIERARYDKQGLPVDRLVDTANAALEGALPSLKDTDLARARFGRLEVALLRAEHDKSNSVGLRLALRAIADELRTTPTLGDESQIGEFVRKAIERVSTTLALRGVKGKPRDLPAELRQAAAKAKGGDADEFRAYAVIVEDLLEIAYARLGKALDVDPLHRRAGKQWVLLSMEAAPHKLQEIYPLLKLLVERDATDESLASLGVAYIGLGNEKFGKALLKRASEFTSQPAGIAELMAWKE